jgi:hypothetical protein
MKSKQNENLLVGIKFSEALDTENYIIAETLLSSNCVYHFRSKIYTGANTIIELYKSSGNWAEKTLDDVKYESRTELVNDKVIITFIDNIRHNGINFTYRCQQLLFFDNSYNICKIEHIDIPGESDKLKEYFIKIGVKR